MPSPASANLASLLEARLADPVFMALAMKRFIGAGFLDKCRVLEGDEADHMLTALLLLAPINSYNNQTCLVDSYHHAGKKYEVARYPNGLTEIVEITPYEQK